ncbi:helix-turn-helix domain-containing protein [Actinoplanes sp. NPDC020271]|uniref:helix-turn-helix domain-containing protein n=1 Tax=Actinoplanes sp. NPDC020271 TaxID=3363896 RepID=UPI00378EB570
MTPRPTADPTIGDRIKDRRLRRNWSIRYAASRAGVSHATWSRIERGLQAADNRFMLADLAGALECSPAELAGTAVPAGDREAVAAHASVHAIRQALVELDLSEPVAPGTSSPAESARRLALVDSLRQSCDYAGAGRLLPDLLRDLRAGGSARALRLICDATFIASSVLRNLGHPAESWLGAERCRDAADASQDPVLQGYAAYARASAASACGSYDRAYTLAAQAVDALGPYSGRPGCPEMIGSLQLICAYASRGRKRPDDSRAWAGEAAALAARTGETTTLGLYFGPANVNIWRIGIEADGDDAALAATIARSTEPGILPYGFRQVFYYTDTARALARLRNRDREAIRFLLVAERVAPQHVHTSSLVQETARALLDRSRRMAGGTELRALCERLRIG